MKDAPDIDQLARRYLDLWQQQVTAWLNEPELADALAKAYVLMVSGITSIAEATGLTKASGGGAPNETRGASRTVDEPERKQERAQDQSEVGPAPAAAAPGDADRDARFLARRVAQLEERIARLESAAAAGRRSTSRRSRPGQR